jgi:4-amino-4-deoxy-L-arabinose transferase-like glycosyltransferase
MIKQIINIRNPWIIFSPFLVLFILIVIIFKTDGTIGDESRYLNYAQNLIQGFYSPPQPNIDLGNGPGYPIIIVPFVAMKLPLIYITVLNALLYYLSIILLFKVLIRIAQVKIALIFCLFWACYINAYENLVLISPETLAFFLCTIIIYNLERSFNEYPVKVFSKYSVLSGFLMGYLALTKPIFGYVILFMILISGIMWLIKRNSWNHKLGLLIPLIAFVTVTPYLVYTYKLTNKVFYLSSFGGDNLFWMSSPYKGEYGSWQSFNDFKSDSILMANDFHQERKSLNLNHLEDYELLSKYTGEKKDNVYKKLAIDNIKSHPFKFMQNCLWNASRMLFNFPYSYRLQTPRTLVRLPFNGIILILITLCIIPTLLNWRKIKFMVRYILIFAFLYLSGSVLGSAETRMFTVTVPALLVWIAYIYQKSVRFKLNLRFNDV